MLVLAIGLAGSVQGCDDASRDRASYCARIAWIARGSPEDFRVLRRSIGAEGDDSVTILDFYYKNGDGRPVIARDKCIFEGEGSERRLTAFYHEHDGDWVAVPDDSLTEYLRQAPL